MEVLESSLPGLLTGAKITVQVTLQAGVLAVIIAVIAGVLRDVPFPPVRFAVGAYVEFFRGTSAFIQIYWVYFVLPLMGMRLSPIAAGTIVLGLNVGAYGSEVVRGALRAVDAGQREASIALSLPAIVSFRRVILPQAMLRTIAPMCNLMIDLLKGTSLLSVIALTELTFAGRQAVSAMGNPLVIYGALLVIYLLLGSPIAWAGKRLEQRVAGRLRVGRAA